MMKYYFIRPEDLLKELESQRSKDYVILYEYLRKKFIDTNKEFDFFLLESCRFFVDRAGYDMEEMENYYDLVNDAYSNLLIHKDKIEKYFKEYVNSLFSSKKKVERVLLPPKNLSETVIDLMLSELDMSSILQHVNLGTQEVDVQSIRDGVKLGRINNVKKMHDTVLFFIEFYNNNNLK